MKQARRTDLLGEGDPVAAGAVLLDVGLELGVLVGRPRPSLHFGFVAAGGSSHGGRGRGRGLPLSGLLPPQAKVGVSFYRWESMK